MSDIFEEDIDENENLSSLEDDGDGSREEYVFDTPLYVLKLDYSCESVYARNEKKIDVRVGEKVIIPTRYGKDMAKFIGISKKPMGIKPSDVVVIERKATPEDLAKVPDNKTGKALSESL